MKGTKNNEISIDSLAKTISGKIIGANNFKSKEGFSGIFNVLQDSSSGDIVVRHWINEKGVEIANIKNVACIITEDPRGNSIEVARGLNFPIIVVDKIEEANAFALKWTINKFVPNSKRIVVSGTNGKSTTSHMIYHILKSTGANTFTNTDSKSEFNTLIDPMVSKLISEEALLISSDDSNLNSGKIKYSNKDKDCDNELNRTSGCCNIDYLVIEVSEVQGWLDKLMKNHAYLMTDAVDPDSVVITNVAMDHIGLVNSINEVFEETSGVVKAINKGTVSLNYDDDLVRSMENIINTNVNKSFFSVYVSEKLGKENISNILQFDLEEEDIIYKNKPILSLDDLPFKSNHFIQNTVAAISACISLNIPIKTIVGGVKSYKPLKRRFSTICENPLIIDDFAHNPEGIKATINAVSNLANGNIWIICAIRGSRGEEINKINAEALVEVVSNIKNDTKNNSKINIMLSSSNDVVDNLNWVKSFEKEIFMDVLNRNNINFIHYDDLHDALFEVYNLANEEDTILLIGAQGMDPAKSLLFNIIEDKTKG